MSISRKAYGFSIKAKKMLSSKLFKTTFLACLSLFLTFGVLNVYAQEGSISPDWSGTKEFHNGISGVEDTTEDNMNSRQGLELLNTAWTGLSLMAPEATENGENVMNNPNIPNDLKRGLLGMVEDASTTAYASYPVINVPHHLAQEWVPGYDQEVTSLYAQNSSSGHNSGYTDLMNSGISPLWNRTLNLSYIAFVVIMIIAGFMIMFRHKLGGQTMVTIGNVLPGVIVSLLLATFSFAIAGLIIDLGGVVTGLVAFVLGDGNTTFTIGNLGGIIKSVFLGDFDLKSFISGTLGGVFGSSPIGNSTGLIAIALAAAGPAGWGALGTMGAVGLLFAVAIFGIVVAGAIKVMIALYKAYFSLLLNVILGPIQITLGAMPGNSHMVNNWFLSIIRNVLVFPVVLFIVNIPNAIANSGASAYLNFPGKLVFEDPSTYGPAGNINVAGGLFMFILRIFVLYFAAQAPKFLEAWFPPNSPKAIGEGIEAAKGNLSKLFLIGGLFK